MDSRKTPMQIYPLAAEGSQYTYYMAPEMEDDRHQRLLAGAMKRALIPSLTADEIGTAELTLPTGRTCRVVVLTDYAVQRGIDLPGRMDVAAVLHHTLIQDIPRHADLTADAMLKLARDRNSIITTGGDDRPTWVVHEEPERRKEEGLRLHDPKRSAPEPIEEAPPYSVTADVKDDASELGQRYGLTFYPIPRDEDGNPMRIGEAVYEIAIAPPWVHENVQREYARAILMVIAEYLYPPESGMKHDIHIRTIEDEVAILPNRVLLPASIVTEDGRLRHEIEPSSHGKRRAGVTYPLPEKEAEFTAILNALDRMAGKVESPAANLVALAKHRVQEAQTVAGQTLPDNSPPPGRTPKRG